ncbi:MAG: ATP-binding protein [Planctomycetota bacterium]
MGSRKKKLTRKAVASIGVSPIPARELRWRCDAEMLRFESTAEVEPVVGVVGQETAMEALRFGLETNAQGQNIFVRGLSGTGRVTLVRKLLQDTKLACPKSKDGCFVYNFQQPDQPKFIAIPAGRGREFKRRIDKLAGFIRNNLKNAFSSESILARKSLLDQAAHSKVQALVIPFEKALKEAGGGLVNLQGGPVPQTTVFPMVNEKPIPPEEFEKLHQQGRIPREQYDLFKNSLETFEQQLVEINQKVMDIRAQHNDELQQLLEKSARWILSGIVRSIENEFPEASVREYLRDLVDDVVNYHLDDNGEGGDFTLNYRVNLILEHRNGEVSPIVVENAPTIRNLLGSIDYEFSPGEEARATHMGICAGSLLRADGGYLILESKEVLSEPGSWKILLRTLRTGKLEIVPPDLSFPKMGPSLKPEPIPLNIKVVLLGDSATYYMLDMKDPEFSVMFKVLADFDSTIPRNEKGVQEYAGVLARITREEQLPPFDKTGVAALAEHGARIAGDSTKLTTRFGRLADIAREAAFICSKENRQRVLGDDVREAIRRGKQRGNLPSRHFREMVADGTIRVETRGSVVGQINGLAVMAAGPLMYGFPARITATIGPGSAGVINIEREAALSGSIHTKGFYILSGLLRYLLKTSHPLAFDASVAFEQSYGGIDGDSASGAEICCLLSTLTDFPLRQDLAMTGAIDQMGHILAIGAVNEKIEGFFDTCQDLGFTGTQGVIIPRANARDLMLREDVVEACHAGQFHVHAVSTVHEALEVLTGKAAGKRNTKGHYRKGTVLGTAVSRAYEFWIKAISGPS